jgi:hypothetical protein
MIQYYPKNVLAGLCRNPPSVPKISQGFERVFYFLATTFKQRSCGEEQKIKKTPNTEEIFNSLLSDRRERLRRTAERAVRASG